jgi:hypothetical protein
MPVVGAFVDFYYRGTMDATGRIRTGALQGSGFTGQIVVLTRRERPDPGGSRPSIPLLVRLP